MMTAPRRAHDLTLELAFRAKLEDVLGPVVAPIVVHAIANELAGVTADWLLACAAEHEFDGVAEQALRRAADHVQSA